MQSMIAYGALALWPVITLLLFMMLPVGRAVIWTILAGYLLLPVTVDLDLPAIPALDKSSIPNLVALMLAPLFAKQGEFQWPRSTVVRLLMLVWVLVPIGTMMNNGQPLIVGSSFRPGLDWWETLSAVIGNVLDIVPFLLGAALLANARGHRDIVRAIVIAALVYTLPILAEIRLSPFLQTKLYGAHSVDYFLQQMRGGGFRAMVFLGHGLLVSLFLAMAIMGALGMWKGRERVFTISALLIAAFLGVVLLLNKSSGAMLLVLAVAPMLLFLRQRSFLAILFLAGAVLATYPMVRGLSDAPIRAVIDVAGQFSPDRAASLEFRMKNEDLLLNRAAEKPLFGWGRFGRNRIIVESGGGGRFTDVAVTDGTWVIVVGIFGWVGYIACFGLLCYPFLRAFRLRRFTLPPTTIALMAMHLVNIIDLIPNSSLRPITWLIAGALANMTLVSLRGRDASARKLPEGSPGHRLAQAPPSAA
ncbi:MAG TPA: hypothetical protein VNS79_05345 [Sphingobium sp.]|nr:hypothetical protein [Sphingobium sp.]